MATYQPPPPKPMQVSRSLPAPSQQLSANTSQPSPVVDKTYSIQANRRPLERKDTINSGQIPCHHAIRATLRYQRLSIPGHDSNHAHPLSEYNYNSIHPDFQGPLEEERYQQPGPSSSVPCCTPFSVPQTISPAETSSSSSYSHTTYRPAAPTRVESDPSMPINASDHLFSPSPTTVSGRSGGVGIDRDEQRKSKGPNVCPVGRSMARPKGSEARKVHVSSRSRSTTVPVPLMLPVQVQANHRTPPVVPQYYLHQDDSVQPSSSVPASTSVPQSPQDKDKDSTSPTTSTPTSTPFLCPSGRSRVNSKVRFKPSTTDPFPTPFKGLRRWIGITKEPDEGKQREQDKQVEDLSSSWCLVGSTVDLGVRARRDAVAEMVSGIRRATDSNRMGAENGYGGDHAMEAGGTWRAGSYPLDPFDAVLLDQYVFALFYC